MFLVVPADISQTYTVIKSELATPQVTEQLYDYDYASVFNK